MGLLKKKEDNSKNYLEIEPNGVSNFLDVEVEGIQRIRMSFNFGCWLILWMVVLFTREIVQKKEEIEERHTKFQVPIG